MALNKTYIILGIIILVLILMVANKSKNTLTGKVITTKGLETATFAGGCFWCMEGPFEAEPGVKEVLSGYAGGDEKNPTYKEVSSGSTGHIESIQVHYDPKEVSYERLLEIFWWQIDPTDSEGQFVDRGNQYKSAIFYKNDKEKKEAEKSKKELEASKRFDKPIVTEIIPLKQFYKAEEYHQDYHKKNPLRYKFYRAGSGRDRFLNEAWGDDRNTNNYQDEIKKLTPIQYKVTQEEGTEPAFNNQYWDNKEPGIYVDIVSGEPLFSSKDKFDSGTGWPSFTKPLSQENIVEKTDRKLFVKRTEIRSKKADSHLGHVFNDGPNGSTRYCMNSASLRFIPKKDLKKEGYGEYEKLFD